MARKRVFLDECNSDLRHVFGPKDHVFDANDFGITGKEDTRVIDEAFSRKCLIVTVNKDFVQYYRDHPMRKGKMWSVRLRSHISKAEQATYARAATSNRHSRTTVEGYARA